MINTKNVDPSVKSINGSYFLIDVDSDPNRVFHFFSYKVQSVWEFKDDIIVTQHSSILGMGTPQEVSFDNWNQTTAFKGDQETVLNVVLTPTKYSDEH